MSGDIGDKDETDLDEDDDELLDDDDTLDDDDELSDADMSDDDDSDIGGDTLVDVTGELKVDDLVTAFEKIDPDEVAHRREVRRRLEELAERRNQELDSTFNFNMDDDD